MGFVIAFSSFQNDRCNLKMIILDYTFTYRRKPLCKSELFLKEVNIVYKINEV